MPSFIQEVSNSASSGSSVFVTVSSTKAASLIVVGVFSVGSDTNHSAPTDNVGNTYQQIGPTQDDGHRLSLWYSANSFSGATSIQASAIGGTPTTIRAFVAEYQGVAALVGTDSETALIPDVTATTNPFATAAGGLVVGFAYLNTNNNSSTSSLQNIRDTSTVATGIFADTVGTTAGTTTVTFTLGTSGSWEIFGASFSTINPVGPFSDQIFQRRQRVSYRRSAFQEPFEWTQFVIIPSAASWNTDTEAANQLAQPPSAAKLASDAGQDWTNTILLPPWDPSLGNTEDDPSDNQLAQLPPVGKLASDAGQDSTGFIILPPLASVLDDSETRQQLDRSVNAAPIASDSGQDSTGFIILPSAASWNTDTEKDNQLAQPPTAGNQASDSGQDTTNFLIIPNWDPSLGNTEDDPSDNQQDRSVKAAQLASDSGQDTTNVIILPPMIDTEMDVSGGEEE